MTAIWHEGVNGWVLLRPVGFPDEATLHLLVAEARYRRFGARGRMRGVFPILHEDGAVRWTSYHAHADVPVEGYSYSRLLGAPRQPRRLPTAG